MIDVVGHFLDGGQGRRRVDGHAGAGAELAERRRFVFTGRQTPQDLGRMLASADLPAAIDRDIDMRTLTVWSAIVESFETMLDTGNQTIRVDVRVVTATNRDLLKRICGEQTRPRYNRDEKCFRSQAKPFERWPLTSTNGTPSSVRCHCSSSMRTGSSPATRVRCEASTTPLSSENPRE